MRSATAGAEAASAARASAPRPNSSRAATSAGSTRASRLATSPSLAASHSASRRTAGSVSCAAGRRLDGGPGRAAAAPFWAAAAPFWAPVFIVLKKPSSLARASQRDAPWGSGGLEAGSSARTRLGRAMFRFDGYTYALEEFGGQHTSGAHDDRIVADLLHLAFVLDGHRLRLDLLHVRFHHDLETAGLRSRLDAIAVARLGAIELRAAVGQDHPAAAVGLGDARGRLEGAVAAADDQHMLAFILLRINQSINHLRHLLARHAELARRATAADREQDAARRVGAAIGLDDEAVSRARDVLDPLLVVDLDAGLALGLRPELEQRLLAGLAEVDLAEERHGSGRRHHELPARVLEHRSAERLLLDRDIAHVLRLGGE